MRFKRPIGVRAAWGGLEGPRRVAAFTLVLALLPLVAMDGGDQGALRLAAAVAQTPGPNVPKADCGPNDRVETGLQGQTTVAEQAPRRHQGPRRVTGGSVLCLL